MSDSTVTAPDTVPATGDPGDDTARRYRYQWTYAAIVCCMLLDDTEDVAEVFCEPTKMCSSSTSMERFRDHR